MVVRAWGIGAISNGDRAKVLAVRWGGETLHVYFHKWDTEPAPTLARRNNRMSVYGVPYFELDADRFAISCMFDEATHEDR